MPTPGTPAVPRSESANGQLENASDHLAGAGLSSLDQRSFGAVLSPYVAIVYDLCIKVVSAVAAVLYLDEHP